jgi:hypothetical protein
MTTPDVGQTIRFPSTSLLTIDSEDRWADYTQARQEIALASAAAPYFDPYNFRLQGNQFLLTGAFTRLGVSEVVMPWCPNINGKTSQIIVHYIDNAAAAHSQTIDLGLLGFGGTYQRPHDLATILQTAIRSIADLSGTSFTYGVNNVPHFAYNASGAVNASAIWFEPLPYNSTVYPYPAEVKQLFDLLGFTNINTLPGNNTGAGLYTDCQAIRYVDIVASDLTKYQGLFDGSSQRSAKDSLCRVYLTTPQNQLPPSDADYAPAGTVPATIYRNFTNPKQIQWTGKQNISAAMTFQVYGDDGLLFSTNSAFANNGSNWSMTILVSEN